jgi:hypothetical protein
VRRPVRRHTQSLAHSYACCGFSAHGASPQRMPTASRWRHCKGRGPPALDRHCAVDTCSICALRGIGEERAGSQISRNGRSSTPAAIRPQHTIVSAATLVRCWRGAGVGSGPPQGARIDAHAPGLPRRCGQQAAAAGVKGKLVLSSGGGPAAAPPCEPLRLRKRGPTRSGCPRLQTPSAAWSCPQDQ